VNEFFIFNPPFLEADDPFYFCFYLIVFNKIKITLNALFTLCQANFTYDAKIVNEKNS